MFSAAQLLILTNKERKMFVSRNQRSSLNKQGEEKICWLCLLSSSFILCRYIWLPRSSMTNVFSFSSFGRTFSDHMNRTRIPNRGQQKARYHRQAAGTEKDS